MIRQRCEPAGTAAGTGTAGTAGTAGTSGTSGTAGAAAASVAATAAVIWVPISGTSIGKRPGKGSVSTWHGCYFELIGGALEHD